MREYGFTTCSGFPHIAYRGFKDGKPVLDFTAADAEMKLAKELGFLAVNTYGGGVSGFDAYHQDTGAMNSAGFKDYAAFIRAVYGAIQKHADANGWLPGLLQPGRRADRRRTGPLGRERRGLSPGLPQGASLLHRRPAASPAATGNDPHLRLAKALHVVSWNGHDEASVKLLHELGGDWAFYNGGNRWTFGEYMYKAAKQFGMKFRISWHWNAAAGDPYYALDCREDDYAWCSGSPDGRLIPVGLVRAAPRGAGRLSPPDHAGPPGQGEGRHAGRRGRPGADRHSAWPRSSSSQRDHDALLPPTDWTQLPPQGRRRHRGAAEVSSLRY